MLFRIAVLSLIALLACDGSEPREPPRTEAVLPPPAPHDDRSRPLDERADLLVEHLAGVLERGDTLALLPLVTPDGWTPDTAAAGAVLADYRHHFRDRPVAGWYRVRVAGDSAAAPSELFATRHYELLSHGNIRKTVAVSYDPINDRLRAWDEFLLHSPRVHRYAQAVAEAIRRADAEGFARLLSPDDVDYPVELARQAIARYEDELDLGTLTVRYDGLAPPRRGMRTTDVARPFRFVIEGTGAGGPVHHEVLVRHGDGLLWWEDGWLPAADMMQEG